eukprot:7897226-Lingulodinium_polyedra.AAC.1
MRRHGRPEPDARPCARTRRYRALRWCNCLLRLWRGSAAGQPRGHSRWRRDRICTQLPPGPGAWAS